MTKRSKRTVAYHEAGHAVIGCVLGFRLKYVTVNEKGDNGTATFWSYKFKGSKAARRNLVERAIQGILAGPIAQVAFEGKAVSEGAWAEDGANLSEFVLPLIGVSASVRSRNRRVRARALKAMKGEPAQALLKRLTLKTSKLVDLQWSRIEHVAADLLKHGALSGREVKALIQDIKGDAS
jgi:hypothetical protein